MWDSKSDYRVVRNAEEQYSIWFSDRELPLGWVDVGYAGTRQECLDHIVTVWTDMRPLSLREHMAATGDVSSSAVHSGGNSQ